MKYKEYVNDIEQESVLGFLTTFGFLKKGNQGLELGLWLSNFSTLLAILLHSFILEGLCVEILGDLNGFKFKKNHQRLQGFGCSLLVAWILEIILYVERNCMIMFVLCGMRIRGGGRGLL